MLDADDTLDALGLICPLPVLRARKRLAALEPGQILRMEADDPAALIDVPHFCNEAGHTLESVEESESSATYLIRKGG